MMHMNKIEPHLVGCSTVIIIPDGDLCFLPWPALPGREPGTYLLEDYAPATVPRSQQLYTVAHGAAEHPDGSPSSRILVFHTGS